MKNAIEVIQLSVSMIMMIVLTALTLVSSETALKAGVSAYAHTIAFSDSINCVTEDAHRIINKRNSAMPEIDITDKIGYTLLKKV